MFIFEMDLNQNKIRNLETLIPALDRWKPLNGLFRITMGDWPFSYHKPPQLSRTTFKSKPIKAKILSWDVKAQILDLSLERYRTQDGNVKVWTDIAIPRSRFIVERQAV